MKIRNSLSVIVVVLAASACGDDVQTDAGQPQGKDSGAVSDSGLSPSDSGVVSQDAAPADMGGPVDSGVAPMDASPVDSAISDSGVGQPDASPEDAGDPDTGPVAGDASTADGAVNTDSGLADGGSCACDLTPGVCDLGCGCDFVCADAGIFGDSGVADSGVPLDSGAGLPDLGPYDGGVPASDPFDPGARAAELATASCSRTQTCAPAYFSAGIYADLADCIAQTSAEILAVYNAYNQGITAGRVGFDQTAFSACISALGSADCVLGVDVAVCDSQSLFHGSQAVNRPCSTLAECATGTYCALPALGSCGTCQPFALPGQDCSAALCAPGLDCFDTGGAFLCVSVSVDQGQACGTVGTGLCRGQLNCQGTNPNYSCQPPAGLGQACDSDPVSTVGPFCNILTNHNCDSNTNLCAAVTWNPANSSCDNELQLCALDSSVGCDPGSMLCVAAPGSGNACVQGTCAQGNYCDAGGICQAEKTQGLGCLESAECEGALLCVSNICDDFPYVSCP